MSVNSQPGDSSSQPDFVQSSHDFVDVVHALQCINHHAGRFNSLTNTSCVSEKDHVRHTIYTSKKNALYGIKGYVLDRLHQYASKIDIHLIGDSDYYCFYFSVGNETISFHRPKKESTIKMSRIDTVKPITNFSKTKATTHDEEELSDALLVIHDVFGIHVNDFMDELHVHMKNDSYYIGWDI